VSGIVHYGFRLIENSLLSTKLPKGLLENSHVVTFESTRRVWQDAKALLGGSERPTLVTKEDLLICERYWGIDHYAIQENIDSEFYFDSVLRLEEGRYQRIIFRPSSSHQTQNLRWGKDIKEYAQKRKIDLVTWSDLFDSKESSRIIDNPEAQFFLGSLAGLGGLFAFDGSLSVLFATLGKNTRVHWADEGDSEGIFIDHRIPNLLLEQGDWMRRVANQSTRRQLTNNPINLHTSGSIYHSIIAEAYLNNSRLSTQKKLSQLADKAAQRADNDAQLADKDAQLASVYGTVSWKITKPLRFFRKLLVKLY
jgi:hypothetical protein